jgi:aryl-alcohol dehydrogenase-like predicted oxidoreductase
MTHGNIDGLEKPVSRLLQGTMMLSDERQGEADILLDAVSSLGCNGFDCAHVYGGGACERARGNREQTVVLTKCCHQDSTGKRVKPECITSDLADSLERLQVDYVDLFLFHRDDPAVPVGPLVETMNRHVCEGKVRLYGGSNWTHPRIIEANEYAYKHGLQPFAASSPNFSLAEQVQSPWGDDCISISGAKGAEAREWYRQQNLPVFGWSSIARGFFSGRWNRENYEAMKETPDASSVHAYCHEQNFQRLDRVIELAGKKGASVAQIALAWVLRQDLNVFALIGCYNYDEFSQCVDALHIDLSSEELAWLDLRA